MERIDPRTLVQGAAAGIAGGLVVALWFLGVDLAAGQPFRTPVALAAAVLGDGVAAASGRLVAAYTFVHFAVFAALGGALAVLLKALRVSPGLTVGAVIGVVVLEAVHYGGLLATGASALSVLPGLHVLAANVLGGMAMMAYLHRATRDDAPLGLAFLRQHELLAGGVVTGLIGALAVAVWFLLLDVMAGRPLYTPAALGSLVLLGATGAADVQLNVGIIAAYTMLHLAAFVAVGAAMVWTAAWLEREPGMWLLTVMAFVLLEGLFFAAAMSMGAWILGALGWWAVGAGNLLAVVAMAAWLWNRRPELRHQLLEVTYETRV